MDGKVEIVPTSVVTNFNVKNGDISAGGESAERRYRVLEDADKKAKGVMSASQLLKAMDAASQKTGECENRRGES